MEGELEVCEVEVEVEVEGDEVCQVSPGRLGLDEYTYSWSS